MQVEPLHKDALPGSPERDLPPSEPVDGVGWRAFLVRVTVWSAVLTLSAGLVFLVAANWPGMSKWERIGLAWLVLIASGLFAWCSHVRQGLRALRTQGALSFAGVALGALLALIGQTYQTGADTWQLFAWWAVLLLPWVIGAPGAAVWLLWGVVANVSLWLWGDGGHLLRGSGDMWSHGLIQGGFNLALMFAWEYTAPRVGVHAYGRTGPRLAALAALVFITVPTIFTPDDELVRGLLFWAAVVGGVYVRYRRVQVDLVILMLLCLSAIMVSLRLLITLFSVHNEGLLLVYAAILMAEAVVAVKWLRAVAAQTQPDRSDYPDASPSLASQAGTPWYMHALVAFGAWLATLLLILFLVFMGLVSSAGSALVLGVLLGVVAVLLSRLGPSAGLFVDQAAIALGGAGLLLVGYGLLDKVDPGGHGREWWLLALLAAALYAGGRGSVLRLLAGLCVAVAVIAGMEFGLRLDAKIYYSTIDMLVLDRVPIASVPMAWAAGWLFLQSSQQRRAALLPAAWAFALVSQAAVGLGGGVTPWALVASAAGAPSHLLLMLAAVLLPAALAAGWLGRAPFAQVPAPLRLGMPIVLALLAIPLLPVPAAAFALAWLVVGQALRLRGLALFGALGGIVYLGIYYYQLNISLLDKGLWLCVAGGVALLLWRFMLRDKPAGGAASAAASIPSPLSSRWQRWVVPAGLCLALVASGWSVAGYEHLLTHGRVVLLELAPVDPRALMQGDYMALRFAVSREIDVYGRDILRDGYMVLAPDQEGVGQLARIQRDRQPPLANGEILLRYRVRNRAVRVVTNAYFFPEGQAARYQNARYGELRIDSSGTALLAGLRDAQREPL